MQELARTPHWTVVADPARSLIRATRTPLPFIGPGEMAGSLGKLKNLEAIDRSKMVLLLDLREGPFNNDETFEQTQSPYRAALFAGWAGIATLVKTAIGKLQVARLGREEGREVNIFNDEAEALAFLASRLK